jgi:4-hydroxy-3-methylbut-2-enyl diphosphate reductase
MDFNISEKRCFCYGVKRAYEKTINLSNKYSNIYLYGQLVHNDSVVLNLKEKGIKIFEDITSLPEDSKNSLVIIRAHGISLKEKEILIKNFEKIVDLTCPIVKKLVEFSQKKQKENFFLIIFGEKNHPEVKCIKGNLDSENILITKDIKKIVQKKICIISQTTCEYNEFKKFYVNFLKNNEFSDIIIKNTICNETYLREKEAEEISKNSDLVIVIGGKNSSNTKKLYNISKNNCSNTFFISTLFDLDNLPIHKNSKIGVLTGASTPEWQMNEILNQIKNKVLN